MPPRTRSRNSWGWTDVGRLLSASLAEEESADRTLARLANSTVNPGALFAEMLDSRAQ